MRGLPLGRLVGALAVLAIVLATSASGAAFQSAGRDRLSFVDGGGGISSVSTIAGSSASDQTGPGLANPAWSPNGTSLAYDNGVSLFVNGTNTVIPGTNPAWSPTGTILYYAHLGDIYCAGYPAAVAPCGSGTDMGSSGTDPAVSPDGTKVAFTNASGQIAVMGSAPLSAPTVLASTGTNASPSWSPDGTKIAFESNRSGTWQIWTMNSDGTSQAQASNDLGDDHHPAWSPDGTRIAFDSGGSIKTLLTATLPTSTYNTITSGSSPDWRDSAPINLTSPSITPPTTVGQTLTADPGQWNGTPTFGYQWQRSTNSGATFANIAGQTAATYTVAVGDLGAGVMLRVQVTATNALGSVTVSGNPAGPAPANVTPPTVTGTPNATFGFLFASTGTWTGVSPITYTYQWLRCFGQTTGNCVPIPGATSSFYTPTGDDINTQLNVAVVATNSAGSGVAYSVPTAYITGDPPHNHVSPTISGGIEVGSVLTTTDGVWTGSQPITFTYQWRICKPDGSDCNSIIGATGKTYTIQPLDYGSTIRMMIRGRNGAGFAYGISNHTFPILHKTIFGPASSQPPTLAGPVRVGQILVATAGTWTGEAPIDFAYAWQRCDATGAACTPIPGQAKATYRLTVNDVGSTIRVQVTATNVVNVAQVSSDASDAVAAPAPHRKGRRIVGKPGQSVIVGTPRDDVIVAGSGNVTIWGMGGYDVIRAGPGNSVIYLGSGGSSHVYGGPGSTTIHAANGEQDTLTCGKGVSRVYVDSFDLTKNCTMVTVVAPAAAPGSGAGA